MEMHEHDERSGVLVFSIAWHRGDYASVSIQDFLFGLPQATQIGTHNLAFTDQITSQS
jgi:hypothetical protein